jgi:hypothetical protein
LAAFVVVGMGVKDGPGAVVEKKEAEPVGVFDANAAPEIDGRDSTSEPVGAAEVGVFGDMEAIEMCAATVKRAPNVEKLSMLVFVQADHVSLPFM